MYGFEQQAPRKMQRYLSDYASLVGMPRVGSSRNYMWSSLQINMATAKHGDSGKVNLSHVQGISYLPSRGRSFRRDGKAIRRQA